MPVYFPLAYGVNVSRKQSKIRSLRLNGEVIFNQDQGESGYSYGYTKKYRKRNTRCIIDNIKEEAYKCGLDVGGLPLVMFESH